MREWHPLSEREGLAGSDDTLHDGVPGWLRRSITEWVEKQVRRHYAGGEYPSDDILRDIERRVRLELDWREDKFTALTSLIALIDVDPRKFLDAVDLLVSDYADSIRADELEAILSDSGSLWRVAERDGMTRLERRVEATVAEAAESAMVIGRPGELLSRAWGEMYGRQPNASAAYRDAVRAVEAAAQPVVLPEDAKATLGKITSAMRDAPAKWKVVFQPDGVDPVTAVVAMLELLWKSQHDRHGDADETRPLAVSDAEAEAAVHLAANLVHLFTGGAISRG